MNDITRQFEAMQRMMFVPSSAALTDNVRRFWDIQDRLLDNMEKFANGWFERRHIGSRAAQEAAQRMCKARDADDLVREYQEWVTGAFQRMANDGLACQQFVGAFAGVLEENIGPQQPTKSPARHSKAA